MVLFKALNRSCTDLLQRGYVHDKRWQAELVHPGENPVLSHAASVGTSGSLSASTSISHIGSWGRATYVFGSNSMQGDVCYKFKHLPGMVFNGQIENMHQIEKGTGAKVISDISLEYNREDSLLEKSQGFSILKPHVKLSVDPFMSKWRVSATTKMGFSGTSAMHVGTEINGLSDFKAVNYSAGMAFSQTAHGKSWTISLMGYPFEGQAFRKLVGGIHCKSLAPGSPEIAAEVTHFYAGSKQPTVTFGGQWYLNQQAEGGKTDTILKLKLTQDAKVALAFSHKLSELVTATIGTQIDALAPEDAKCGVALKISA